MDKVLSTLSKCIRYLKSFIWKDNSHTNRKDRTISVDMTDILNPRIKLGKLITPNDVATYIVRTAINMDAKQYVEGLAINGHTDIEYRLGTLTTSKMNDVLTKFLDDATKPEQAITDAMSMSESDNDEPVVSPMNFGIK